MEITGENNTTVKEQEYFEYSTSLSLVIDPLDFSHEGDYTCEARLLDLDTTAVSHNVIVFSKLSNTPQTYKT